MFVVTRPVAATRGFFDTARYFGGTPATRTPALDVSETDTHYLLAFDVPGVARDQLKVTAEGRRVTIETLDATAKTEDTAKVLYRERTTAKYARTVSLPAEVDQANSQAKF